MSRFLRLPFMTLIVFLMAFMLAACGTTPPANVTQSSTQNVTVKDALGGTLSVTLPTGTFNRADEMSGSVTIATSEALLSPTQPTVLTAGQWQLIIGALPNNVAQALVPGGQTVSPETMIAAIKAQMEQTEPKVTFGVSTPLTIGTHNAARVTGTSTQGDVLLIVIALDNSYLLSTGVVSVGQLATLEPTLTSIITSASYVPAS